MISFPHSHSATSDVFSTFNSLNNDVLHHILQYLGKRSYIPFAILNRQCHHVFLNINHLPKETFIFGYAPLTMILRQSLMHWLYLGEGVVNYNRNDVLNWFLRHQNTDELCQICCVAAAAGRIDILRHIFNNSNQDTLEQIQEGNYLCTVAARYGRSKVLKWLENNGCMLDIEACYVRAAQMGQLSILKWLHSSCGYPLHARAFLYAAENNHLAVLQWLRSNGCFWHEETFSHAVRSKSVNIEILQWLLENGCPWSALTFTAAVRSGNIDILRWLVDNGCPRDDRTLVFAGRLRPDVEQWFLNDGFNIIERI